MSNVTVSADHAANIFSVSPEQLVLDKDNPRLLPEEYSGQDMATDEDVIKALAQYDLEELLQSIAQNGYLNIEPLYVVPEAGGKYKVLEGNRRLAAIKLFRDPVLAKACGVTLPALEEPQARSLNSILVYETQDENSGLAYIGFKHINGPHKWDSIAKARFILRLYKRGIQVSQISKMIGDTHDTIKKMLLGMTVLEQAAEAELFTAEDRHPSLKVLPFSHLYTALTRKEYQKFLDIGKEFSENPVPMAKLENLENVLRWLFGSKKDDIKPVIGSQNPDIKRLGTVLTSTRALAVLATTKSLDDAFQQTISPTIAFKDALVAAVYKSKDALNYASDVENADEDAQNLSLQLKNTANTIHGIINKSEDRGAISGDAYQILIEALSTDPKFADIFKMIGKG